MPTIHPPIFIAEGQIIHWNQSSEFAGNIPTEAVYEGMEGSRFLLRVKEGDRLLRLTRKQAEDRYNQHLNFQKTGQFRDWTLRIAGS